MEFLLAVQFLTMIPVTIRGRVDESNMARAMAWFPFVGLLLGIMAATLYLGSNQLFAESIAVLIALGSIIVVTGNLHGDGLMDTVDGIFSGRPRERMLEIMKDSRVGSHGVTAGVLIILAKFTIMLEVPDDFRFSAFILIPVLGRWAQVYGSAFFSYARAEGGTGSFTDKVGYREIFWASVTVLISIVAVQMVALSLLSASTLVSSILNSLLVAGGTVICIILAAKYISRKLGGLTGDTYGALNEVAEIAAMLLFVLVSGS